MLQTWETTPSTFLCLLPSIDIHPLIHFSLVSPPFPPHPLPIPSAGYLTQQDLFFSTLPTLATCIIASTAQLAGGAQIYISGTFFRPNETVCLCI